MSSRLGRFAKKKEDLYNFRCPLCGDSQKNKTKSRGYIFRKKNDYFYMCHNCGVSTTFFNFLKQIDPALLKEYQLERYTSNQDQNIETPKFEEFKHSTPVFKKTLSIPSIESLPSEHFARKYVEARKIPESFYGQLYYAEDFKNFIDALGIDKDGLTSGDKRLVIPFYDKDKNLIALQGRSLGESKLRYITVKIDDVNKKIFGQDRINTEKRIYVFEGPFDSMFIENSVATADSHLEAITDVYNKSDVVLVFDNEPRNKEILKQIERAIDNHFNVVIWPEMVQEKDTNEMIINGFTSDEIRDIIDNHTHQNLRAKMEFVNWKKL